MSYSKYKEMYINQKLIDKTLNEPHNPLYQENVFGAIHGFIFGDAFGSRYEFMTSKEARDLITADTIGDYIPLKGGGPFELLAGQVTDDSEMMFCLLNSIIENKTYNQSDVATKYIEWYHTKPFDIGKTIERGLKGAAGSADMVANSLKYNKASLSNGSLMRILPIGLYGIKVDDKELKRIVALECDLTHPNEFVKEMCYIYVIAVKYSCLKKTKQEIYEKILSLSSSTILESSLKAPEPILVDGTYVKTDDKLRGYIGIAIQNVIYEFMHTDSGTEAIINIAKRGGDTDTNCALIGGLMGAFYGTETFDTRWYKTVLVASKSVKRYRKYKFLNPMIQIEIGANKMFNLVREGRN